MPIGNDVVGIDFSSVSADVAARAALLPVERSAAITLVHVVPARLPDHLTRGFHALAKTRLGELRQTVVAARERGRRPPVEILVEVAAGSAAEALCSYGREARAELVVVGAGDARARRARGVGSTAERVIRAAHSPALVVARPPDGPYVRPLVAVDLSPLSATVIATARRLAEDAHAFDLLHAHVAGYVRELRHAAAEIGAIDDFVSANARACADDLARLAGQAPASATWRSVLREGDARDIILDGAMRNQSDLVVIGACGHSVLAHLLLGSVAEAIVRAAPCDVLVARRAAAQSALASV
jgi:nucleotide-binding universal stress UspA family protein